jgi:hypothetical protein
MNLDQQTLWDHIYKFFIDPINQTYKRIFDFTID